MEFLRRLAAFFGITLPTLKEFGLGLSADAAKIAAGHFKVYDKIVDGAAKIDKVPTTRLGQIATIAALSYAGTAIKVNSNEKTFLGNLKNELGGDLTSELVLSVMRRAKETKKESV